ncbi:hypothetical protein Tco_1173271 [Tanacetum coccineum]
MLIDSTHECILDTKRSRVDWNRACDGGKEVRYSGRKESNVISQRRDECEVQGWWRGEGGDGRNTGVSVEDYDEIVSEWKKALGVLGVTKEWVTVRGVDDVRLRDGCEESRVSVMGIYIGLRGVIQGEEIKPLGGVTNGSGGVDANLCEEAFSTEHLLWRVWFYMRIDLTSYDIQSGMSVVSNKHANYGLKRDLRLGRTMW